ncbi:sialate O-acetylesterase, partial [Verrucomicrobia bacterium]|nr:sialate O-acetylesterase [Verrucomicrobiota bacterium]
MIEDWRARFDVGDFPFLIVQLANFMARDDKPTNTNWSALREAQSLTAENDPQTGLAVIIDIGEAN